jgi:aminoglycoside N3'-acetyltransferase
MMPTLPDIYRPFDALTSPSTVGKVSEAFRLRPEARRSRHPSHAVAAIGPRAQWLTQGHERVDPTGPDSPYDRLRALDGWIVLLGVDHDRNTMLHLAEALAESPYLRPADLEVVGDDGAVTTVRVPNMAYGHREFIGLDRRLRQAGLQRLGRIGDAVVRAMRSDALIGYCVDLLRREPAALLCAKPSCIFCRWARARLAEQQGCPDGTDWRQVMAREGCGERRCECCVV